MTKIIMKTKGRRRSAIKRAHRTYLVIAAHPGSGPGYLRDQIGCSSGEWQTAIKYLLEDGLVEQVGNRRGARYYPRADIDDVEMNFGISDVESVIVEPEIDCDCTFCEIAPVDAFQFYTSDSDDLDNDHKFANIRAAVRQAFHVCKRCAGIRLPGPQVSTVHGESDHWTEQYVRWQNPDISVELTIKIVEWVYGITNDGSYQLHGVVELPESNDDNLYLIQFTFNDNHSGLTKYARGYKYMHRLFSHPDHLIDKKLVVSRERHKRIRSGGGVNWFWSWTPWPRVPPHLRNEQRLDDDASATTELDGGPAPDITAPQHHIHSIQDHGTYTIIRINKRIVDTDDMVLDRVEELKNVIERFLYGEGTMTDLENILHKED